MTLTFDEYLGAIVVVAFPWRWGPPEWVRRRHFLGGRTPDGDPSSSSPLGGHPGPSSAVVVVAIDQGVFSSSTWGDEEIATVDCAPGPSSK